MRPVSSRLIDDSVSLTLNAWGTDADGSRVIAGTTIRYDVPAAVLAGRGRTEVEHSPESGLSRVTHITPYVVGFEEDVGLSVHDLVAWTDDGDATHTLLVIDYGQPAGRPGFFAAQCEERS